ncbi:MAG: hypothetical protein LC624_04640, partial [Halobacteriales archaeon]|nr:hypothetical protein [Halobacteriales archaeon]
MRRHDGPLDDFFPGTPRAWSSNPARRYREWREELRTALAARPTVPRPFSVELSFVLASTDVQPLNLLNSNGADVDN